MQVVSRTTLTYLGPYRLLNVVHTGQIGQIWQAYDDGNQRFVGIKVLHDRFKRSREHIRYLRWEYKVARRVVHPCILEIFAYAVDRGTPYVAMEWFPAPNMKQRIQQGIGKMLHLVPKIIEQAASALAHFGRQGFVHRDIKPDNFLVADSGEVKLIDFALARRIRRGLWRLLPSGSKLQGTRTYMSPEQIRGEWLDERSDLYSFGCTLYELLTGKPPFTGSTQQELFSKHLKAPPPVLETIDSNITPEFAQLVRRCLAKDRRQRPGSAAEFLEELGKIKIFRITPRPLPSSGITADNPLAGQ